MPDPFPVRKAMCHHPPFPADDAWYFITMCAAERGGSPFTDCANAILDAARHYHRIGKWSVALFLVMPDHIHAILHFPPDGRACHSVTAAFSTTTDGALDSECGGQGLTALPNHVPLQHRPVGMSKTIADWKHYLTNKLGLAFQRDFFDTRIRDDVHYAEKFQYVCANPVRKGLCAEPRDWPRHRVRPRHERGTPPSVITGRAARGSYRVDTTRITRGSGRGTRRASPS